MKTKLTVQVLSVFLGINAVALSAQAAPCAENRGYTLSCRGGYMVQNGGAAIGNAYVDFAKAPVAAGPYGASLEPGQCAWEDRPVNGSEPARFHGSFSPASAGSMGWFELVSQCAFNRSCVVTVCVTNVGSTFNAVSNEAIVRFPF